MMSFTMLGLFQCSFHEYYDCSYNICWYRTSFTERPLNLFATSKYSDSGRKHSPCP